MSGPIVRKYGFPNFEQIFGKRELQHGVDEPPQSPKDDATAGGEPTPAPKPADPSGTDQGKRS